MTTRRRLAFALLLAVSVAACGGDKNPNNPTPNPPAPTPTRIIRIDGGPLNFGEVQVGQTNEQVFRIFNEGTATMNVTGLQTTGGGSYVASWTNGAIAPSTSQSVTVRFTPAGSQNYSGTLTVNADHTSGTNTTSINARGVLPPRPQFGRTGVGNTVFDMPKDVARLRIIGVFNGRLENFIVNVGGRLVVNEIIGTGATSGRRYQGDHVVPAACAATAGLTCPVEITSSNGVEWSFEELR